MNLAELYRCLCDPTRLRILHLLQAGPLCVCHFQTVLELPQVSVSKHLAYLRTHGMVEAHRHGQWVIYSLPRVRSRALELQLNCLRECVRSDPRFQADLRRLHQMQPCCSWVAEALAAEVGPAPAPVDRPMA